MKIAVLVIVLAVMGGGYLYSISRPGPAEQAGAVLDEALDKTKRIIGIVKE